VKQLLIICTMCLLASCAKQEPQLSIIVGPTPIQRGDALGGKDITVSNGLFAIAFAVETAPPWGVARGGIVDIALLEDGKPGYDIIRLSASTPFRMTRLLFAASAIGLRSNWIRLSPSKPTTAEFMSSRI